MDNMKLNNLTMFIAKDDGNYEKVTEIKDISDFTLNDSESENNAETHSVINDNKEISFTCKYDSRTLKKTMKTLMGWKCKGPVRNRKIMETRNKIWKDQSRTAKYIKLLCEFMKIDITQSEYFRFWNPIDITGLPCHSSIEWLLLCIHDSCGEEVTNDA